VRGLLAKTSLSRPKESSPRSRLPVIFIFSRPDIVKNLTLSRSFTKSLQLVEEGKTKFFQFETSKNLLRAIGKSEYGKPFLKFRDENISFWLGRKADLRPSSVPLLYKKRKPKKKFQGRY
jgi:hypothetical protein